MQNKLGRIENLKDIISLMILAFMHYIPENSKPCGLKVRGLGRIMTFRNLIPDRISMEFQRGNFEKQLSKFFKAENKTLFIEK